MKPIFTYILAAFLLSNYSTAKAEVACVGFYENGDSLGFVWSKGQQAPNSALTIANDLDDVQCTAYGEERQWVYNHMNNLTQMNPPGFFIRWYGDQARFIAANLYFSTN